MSCVTGLANVSQYLTPSDKKDVSTASTDALSCA